MSEPESKTCFPTYARIIRAIRWLWKKTWKYSIAVFIILVVAHAVTTLVLKNKVEHALAKIKASGAPVTMSALAGQKPPNSKNAAVIYDRIFQILESPNARNDVDVLIQFASSSEREKKTDLQKQALPATIRLRQIIPLVEEAVSRPTCKFEADWESGPAVLFPQYTKIRNLARVLSANTLLATREGKTNEAL